MPIQTQNLVMTGLGVEGDSPPNGLQPPLVDGVHLRWAFKRDLGFPWYGFYLFRRRHQRGRPLCFAPVMRSLPLGPLGTNRITTSAGEVGSDEELVLTDDFPAGGVPELDLAGRRHLRLTLPPGQLAHRAEIRVGFRRTEPEGEPNGQSSIRVTALLDGRPVGEAVLTGQVGQIATAAIAFDAISAVEVTGGPAALIDICSVPVSQTAISGWQPIREFPYALCLPLTHPDYPCSGSRPVNPAAAQGPALNRVLYGPPGDWAGTPFDELHEQLVNLVVGGPGSIPMASRTLPPIDATPVPPDPGLTAPTMPRLAPLDLILLGSLHPAIAQLIGMYWVDQKAPVGVSFDYLIVADYIGDGGGSANELLSLLQQSGFAQVEGYIVYDVQRGPAAPLPAPDDVRAYALPGSSRRAQGGGLEDATNNAGLRWQMPVNLGVLQPGNAVMYHVWRTGLGDAAQPAAPGSYDPLTKAETVLVAEPHIPPGVQPERAADWPPFPLHYVDTRLNDGWYGYQVSGVDIFGRHSPNSAAATWYQWTPVPDPRPWYFLDPAADTAIHPSAVRLLDKLPPPPPTGVEAYLLDPDDPTVVKDAAYDAWWAHLSPLERTTIVGLRVRWQWPTAHHRHAPDVREFRIYYQPGQLNALIGRTGSVSPDGAESDIETDIANTHPADAYAGAWLRIGLHSFPVIGSPAGSSLRLRVKNIGLTYSTGALSIQDGSAILEGAGTNWHAGMTDCSLQLDGEAAVYTVLSVQSPTQLTLSHPYAGATGAGKAYTVFDVRPGADTPCTLVIPGTYGAGTVSVAHDSPLVAGTGAGWHPSLVGQSFSVDGHSGRYIVQSVDSPAQITLARAYAGPSSTSMLYSISHPLFTDYGVPASWSARYHVVAFDEHVTITTDGAGRLLRRYEVLLPLVGDAFRDGVPLATSAAEPIAYAHVGVSAADDKVHTADAPKWVAGRWGDRPGNEGSVGPPATVFRVHRVAPPAPEPPPDAERVFATPADYHGRSLYTYRWRPLPHLRTHLFRALDDALFKGDWAMRPRPALSDAQLLLFPDEAADPRWSTAKRQHVAAELNQLNGFSHDAAGTQQAMGFYRELSNDALRVLAGLGGNERAFAQLTIQPLDSDDPANANRLGPDNPPGFVIDPALRAHVDTLDGRSTSRYFYRSAYVDGAHNRGALSGSGPPIWLPDVVPPRVPRLTRALGGDRQIALGWTSNREPDLAEYRVYRTERDDAARDPRRMTLAHTESVPAGDPTARPSQVLWTDSPVPGRVTFHYCLVAVDDSGNVSAPSQALAARAFDESRPAPPTWSVPVAGPANALQLAWTSPIGDLRCLVQRHLAGATTWENASGWLPRGVYSFDDQARLPGLEYVYRLRVMDSAGRTNGDHHELIV